MKTALINGTDDPMDWHVKIDNREVRQDVVFSADTVKGEVVIYKTDGNGLIIPNGGTYTRTGNVSISPRIKRQPATAPVVEDPAPAQQAVPDASPAESADPVEAPVVTDATLK